MKDNDVEFIGTLLSLDTEAVNGALEDGTVGEKIKALNLMGTDQVDTLKENLSKEVKSTYFSELVEKAKSGELDQELYKPIHGAVLEKAEKDLAKTYNVERSNLPDMVAKISKNGQSNDNEQLVKDIVELREANERLVLEKDEAVTNVKSEYSNKLLSREKADQLNKVPFDFSDVDEDKLEKVKASRRKIINDVFDASYTLADSEGITVVKDKDGKIVKDPVTLTPLTALNVMKDLAVELGQKLKSPESGGQGGSSSGNNGSAPFASTEDFVKYCDSKGIQTNSAEGVKIWSERRPKQT